MKFKFKVQQYQTDAVESTVKVFSGQPKTESLSYIRDLGVKKREAKQMKIKVDNGYYEDDNEGFKNKELLIKDDIILKNIRTIQKNNNIKLSKSLVKSQNSPSLDIEMETGTGKTYVYIKTMFELNKVYGWTKFIIVVPSIAIREGVKKGLDMTEDHFMEEYGKKIRSFIYNSSDLNQIDQFSVSGDIYAMIINTQAFNTSMKEGGKSKESRIIYSKRDEFRSRRPIDVIAANNPIIILDEPQKMGGPATQKALNNFNPLFTLNYSATHSKEHNLIYVLDALDAYNEKLVKRIEVKGFELKNFRGTDQYLYLDEIIVSPNHPPKARLELEIGYQKSINRESRIVEAGDNLYFISKEMEQYKGYIINEINPLNNSVSFTNGEIITKGELVGDISEKDMRRIQIRETIKSHFEKEASLFKQGIKTLSLFFIDEVSKYRQYDENGQEILGEYGVIFESEYMRVLAEYRSFLDKDYLAYLDSFQVGDIHNGYFSIDKSGRSIDSTIKRGQDSSDDISAYDLILKNKERLLSFKEPTRFIFSHSALREGWDNPNVFQICTLKHSDSTIGKRQEVGRGLRICVNQDGDRMDKDLLGELVHDTNLLTVIASDSYSKFVNDLQKDIKEDLYDRPTKATKEYFVEKVIQVDGEFKTITEQEANEIFFYLAQNAYIDSNYEITEKYHEDLANDNFARIPELLKPIENEVHILIQGIFDEQVLKNMFQDGHATKVPENKLNDNFYKEEFQKLWGLINHKYAYKVSFNSKELVDKAINYIDEKLSVSKLQYTVSKGIQNKEMEEHSLDRKDAFTTTKTKTEVLEHSSISQVEYDLIGKIAEDTVLTRKTVVEILKGIKPEKFHMFKDNPEEFISKIGKLIKSQKATMIVEHIGYNQTDGKYDSTIFTLENRNKNIKNAYKADKHIQDYVFVDGLSENSVERKFVEDIDKADEVVVYAKLPKGFHIPTPVGNYTPDWAIAFKEGTVKHIYFIAETKGSLDSMDLRKVEEAKIDCARKLFNKISTENLKYDHIKDYESLLNIVK